MSATAPRIAGKWRPSVGLVLFLVIGAVLALPLVGLFFFRIAENALIRHTEAELIGQGAALAAVLRRDIEADALADVPLGAAVAPEPADEPYRPVLPGLDLTTDAILPRRPDARPPARPPHAAMTALGARWTPALIDTQRATLAGFRVLDPGGVVIAGRGEIGQSLAHVEEVAAALRGQFRAVMRLRVSSHEPPPLYSWSRGTSLRVFTATPVVVRGRVAAVVYASRTPGNVFKALFEERGKVGLAALAAIGLAGSIGFVLHRAITRPMRELTRRTRAVERGEAIDLSPPPHHGTREFAQLSQSFVDMAANLRHRSDFVATFAAHVSHELKSPLTSIQGAAELIRDDIGVEAMRDDDKRRFLDNIIADTGRLTAIVQRLRELARAEATPLAGVSRVADLAADLRSAFPRLDISASGDLDAPLAMSQENLRIALAHLADNAARHGATRLGLSVRRGDEAMEMAVRDDGEGVAPADRARVFDNFFTTRRESGGTGLGLAIVRAMLRAHGGDIDLARADGPGAVFVLRLPHARA